MPRLATPLPETVFKDAITEFKAMRAEEAARLDVERGNAALIALEKQVESDRRERSAVLAHKRQMAIDFVI